MGSYLSIALIADDEHMTKRMYAAVTEQMQAGNFNAQLPNVSDPFSAQEWVNTHKYVWAASPGWSDAWDYALAQGNEDPGKDPGVITDAMILSEVQSLGALSEAAQPEA